MMLLRLLSRATAECAHFRSERGASQGLRVALMMRKEVASEGLAAPEDGRDAVTSASSASLQPARPTSIAQADNFIKLPAHREESRRPEAAAEWACTCSAAAALKPQRHIVIRHFHDSPCVAATTTGERTASSMDNPEDDDHLPGMPDAPAAAAATYFSIAAFQVVCAAPHLMAPEMVAATLFAVRPLDPLFHFPLNQLVGIGYVASSLTLLALAAGAAKKELHKTKFRRLNLGMMASSAALLAVRAVHSDLQTPVADFLTVVQAGLTAGIPFYYYSMTKKHGFVTRDVVKRISLDLKSLLHPANVKSAVYAALTATFLGLTASNIIAPVPTLTSIIQGANTSDCIALWRNVGAALLVLPTWTMSLKESADWNSPAVNLQPEIQTLNLGLSLVGFGHLMVLLPLWDFPEAGPWLHTVATFWGCVGSIGLLGALPPYGPKVASTP